MIDVDDIVAALGRITTRLSELPDDAFEERAELHERRAVLRELAREARDDARAADPRVVDRRIAALERRILALGGETIRFTGESMGGNSAVRHMQLLNERIVEAQGVPELQAELRELRAARERMRRR